MSSEGLATLLILFILLVYSIIRYGWQYLLYAFSAMVMMLAVSIILEVYGIYYGLFTLSLIIIVRITAAYNKKVKKFFKNIEYNFVRWCRLNIYDF